LKITVAKDFDSRIVTNLGSLTNLIPIGDSGKTLFYSPTMKGDKVGFKRAEMRNPSVNDTVINAETGFKR